MSLFAFVLIAATAIRAHAQSPQPGATFRDCPDCPEMVVIPAGSFLMGSSAADTERDLAPVPPLPSGFSIDKLLGSTEAQRARKFMAYEHPQHRVTIPNDFALGKYPVTAGEFAAFVRATGYRAASCYVLIGNRSSYTFGQAWQDPGFSVTANDPIVCVSWNDAKAYIAWLNGKLGSRISGSGDHPYRLPSEAEWEYAARAGTQTARWWGDELGLDNANCGACRDTRVPPPIIVNGRPIYPPCCGSVQQRTTPVGSYPANPFGLYDMLGNVIEWTEDCWHADYNNAPANGGPWDNNGHCSERVARGSSWNGTATWPVRSATRTAFHRTDGTNQIGFRVAKTLN